MIDGFFVAVYLYNIVKNTVMKAIIGIVVLLCIGITMPAQIEKKVAIMPQVGLNFSKFSDEPQNIDYGFRTGFHAGLFVRTNQTIFIQPGIFYSRNGNQLYHYDDISVDNILSNVDYSMIKLPMFFGLKIWNLRVYTGPTVSFPVSVFDNSFGLEYSDFSLAAFGMNLGAGFHIGIFSFDFNYEFGLTPLSPVINNKTDVLSVNAGLHFKF